MRAEAGRVVLLLLVAAGSALANQARTRTLKLGASQAIKSDQERGPQAIETFDGMRRNAGDRRPTAEEADERSPRANRDELAVWGQRDNDEDDDADFVRVGQNVQTGLNAQPRPSLAAHRQPSSAKLEKAAKTTTTSEPESLNQFLLVRPANSGDKTGAISSRKMALRQPAAAPQTSPSSSTAANPSLDYLTQLFLDSSMQLEVRAHLGETAYLVCRLRASLQQDDQLQVSWFRNLEILTSGELRHTSDERFRPSHQPGSSDWLLELHNVRAGDEGDYECQVNSAARSTSVRVRLVVVSTSLEIFEGPEVRVGLGDQLKLTCRVQFRSQAELRSLKRSQEAAEARKQTRKRSESSDGVRRRRLASAGASTWQPYIYWYKDQNYLRDNRVSGQRNLTGGGLENVLRVGRVGQSDAGSYTCKLLPDLFEVEPARARVVVEASGSPVAAPSRVISLAASLFVLLTIRRQIVLLEL